MTVWHDPALPSHDVGPSPLDIGTRRRTGEPVPRPGSWEVVDHDCPAAGTLSAFGPPDTAPPCPGCGAPTTWQLTHLATSVAAEHRGMGHLP
jgi:hypothetical protein